MSHFTDWITTVLITMVTLVHEATSLQSNATQGSRLMSAEKRLLHDLLSNYDIITLHGRPVRNVTSTVNVKFGIGLIQMELDEKDKALSLSLWSKMVWQDEYLQWTPSEYAGLSVTKLNVELLWIPDVMLYNTAETETHTRETQAIVFFNGTVVWTPHQKLKSSCSIDVTNFPFDKQKCHMWFGSWTYTTKDINLTMAFAEGMDMTGYTEDFQDSNQFEIVKLIAERRVLPSMEEDPNYAVLTYTLLLRRNVVFASYILTLPCVFLACLTLVVFWLPPDRPDRTALAMSIFASFLLLLLILVEAAPSTSTSVPLLGVYYCFNMVIIMLAIFLSSLVVNVCRLGEDQQPVPRWLRKLFLEGPFQCLCICNGLIPSSAIESTPPQLGSHDTNNATLSRPLLQKNGVSPQPTVSMFPVDALGKRLANHNVYNNSLPCRGRKQNGCHIGSNTGRHHSAQQTIFSDATTSRSSFCHDDIELISDTVRRLNDVSKSVTDVERCITSASRDSIRCVRIRRDWTNIAIILDRIFFLTYVAIIILSISILFPRPST